MILLIDNYDSFVYNLERYLQELNQNVVVYRNDAITLEQVRILKPKAIVISPGPCTPKEAGISNDIIHKFSGVIPIFGVCLGHQCIGDVFGGRVIRAPYPIHGKTAKISYDETACSHQINIFDGLPQGFSVMRYHSLIIDSETLPDVLVKTAWIEGGDMIMGVRHKIHPTFGVQFHPESVATEHGHKMLSNFLKNI